MVLVGGVMLVQFKDQKAYQDFLGHQDNLAILENQDLVVSQVIVV